MKYGVRSYRFDFGRFVKHPANRYRIGLVHIFANCAGRVENVAGVAHYDVKVPTSGSKDAVYG